MSGLCLFQEVYVGKETLCTIDVSLQQHIQRQGQGFQPPLGPTVRLWSQTSDGEHWGVSQGKQIQAQPT